MKLAWSFLVLGLALAAGAAGPPKQDDLKKILPDVEAVKRSSRKLSKEGREKVEKSIERKLDEKEAAPPIWEARGTVPEVNSNEKIRILYTVVTGKGPKGEFRIGVAAAPEERVLAGVLMLENKDVSQGVADDFLLQFDQFRYSANLSNPTSALDRARAAAAKREDAAAKQADGIFKLHALMHPVGGHWAKLQEHLDKESKDAAQSADQVAKLFGDTEGVLADFTFLKQSQLDTFRRRLREGAKELEKFSKQARAGKFAEARQTATETYNMSCSQCHAGTRRIFRDKRAEFGIGNGYFVAGHDVVAPEGAKEFYDAVARSIRLGLLILTEAK
jgi:ElaB/YqjD/DUF883 family membrane-anchored ribosome-binding protein